MTIRVVFFCIKTCWSRTKSKWKQANNSESNLFITLFALNFIFHNFKVNSNNILNGIFDFIFLSNKPKVDVSYSYLIQVPVKCKLSTPIDRFASPKITPFTLHWHPYYFDWTTSIGIALNAKCVISTFSWIVYRNSENLSNRALFALLTFSNEKLKFHIPFMSSDKINIFFKPSVDKPLNMLNFILNIQCFRFSFRIISLSNINIDCCLIFYLIFFSFLLL